MVIIDRGKTYWVLVGDGARVRFFSLHPHPLRLDPVDHTLVHEVSTGQQDLECDRHGNAQRHRKEEFAHKVAHAVNAAADRQLFQELIVVSPDRFLGDLRGMLKPLARRMVSMEISGDWTHMPPCEILPHLTRHVAPLA